eukprot:TRINITY_DN32038_c0_g1_i1.p1 TRINITY_DN32038_c0_g1~~TRINITY_DN32038_c0_g1_i1.p1  ORF type:complete len:215 (-),score=50.46 TRINITY_DN32038_c0_g1_i1:593-1237(-)
MRYKHAVLKKMHETSPFFGCYGLHEWAMVYQPDGAEEVNKTQKLPFRLLQSTINEVVETSSINCTHIDAVRFFTPQAKPMNRQAQLIEEHGNRARIMLEQPGCVHAVMDLFKWAIDVFPFASSDIVFEALVLGLKARAVDMRASPYCLGEVPFKVGDELLDDLRPITVENPSGRLEYSRLQKELFRSSCPVRKMLMMVFDAVLRTIGEGEDCVH